MRRELLNGKERESSCTEEGEERHTLHTHPFLHQRPEPPCICRDSRLFAIQMRCPHALAMLSGGEIEEYPDIGASFDATPLAHSILSLPQARPPGTFELPQRRVHWALSGPSPGHMSDCEPRQRDAKEPAPSLRALHTRTSSTSPLEYVSPTPTGAPLRGHTMLRPPRMVLCLLGLGRCHQKTPYVRPLVQALKINAIFSLKSRPSRATRYSACNVNKARASFSKI